MATTPRLVTVIAALAVAGLSAAATPTDAPELMNAGGVPYAISNPPGSTKDWKGQPGTYSTDFLHNVDGPVEYFDVYGEVQTQYSQVYWTRNLPINLPPAIVKRFQGKVMAITGYEVDQVTHTAVENSSTTSGDNLGGFSCYPSCSDTDKSVPIYHAYNHHYFSWLQGADAEVYDGEERSMPNPSKTHFRDLPHDHGFPTNIVFKENPGGEFRKSYHGYPSGYAQLIHSPTQWIVEPMQIDTHNRDYDINDQEGYKPAFLPQADYKTSEGHNLYNLHSGLSPLIECPCSDRITRRIVNDSQILTTGTCGTPMSTLSECSAAVADIATLVSSVSVSNASLPAGCIMVPLAPGLYQAVFNTAASKAGCDIDSDRGSFTWKGPIANQGINCADGASCLVSDPKYGCTGEFKGQCTWDNPEQAQANCGKYQECLGFMCGETWSPGKQLCFGRATEVLASMSGAQAYIKEFARQATLAGRSTYLQGALNLSVAHDGTTVNITMSGADGSWFGAGFDAAKMADLPYAIIVDGSGAVTERKLVEHGPGSLLQPSLKTLSSSVADAIRTVVVSRPVAGLTKDHYTFPTTPREVNMITAVGDTPALAYHKARTSGSLTLAPRDASSCLCQPTSQAYLTYMNATTERFAINCVDEPRSDMLRHGDGTGRALPNAACQMMTYHGGLRCCKHHFFLTDVEQAPLIPNKTDTYFLKWRYYFQEYEPATPAANASHQHLHHYVFLIDADVNDYEEDNAHYGDSSIGKLTAHLTAGEMGLEDVPPSFSGITPLVMTPHCHAPSCIRQELWNADTGEIVCNMTAKYGQQENGAVSGVFNELDYIAILPCIYGHQAGLQAPFTLTADTNITAIKYFNNTYSHLGQMAQWTGLMVYEP